MTFRQGLGIALARVVALCLVVLALFGMVRGLMYWFTTHPKLASIVSLIGIAIMVFVFLLCLCWPDMRQQRHS